MAEKPTRRAQQWSRKVMLMRADFGNGNGLDSGNISEVEYQQNLVTTWGYEGVGEDGEGIEDLRDFDF